MDSKPETVVQSEEPKEVVVEEKSQVPEEFPAQEVKKAEPDAESKPAAGPVEIELHEIKVMKPGEKVELCCNFCNR